MTIKEFLNSEYAKELTKILKNFEPLATDSQIKKTLEINFNQLEYNGYFRRNSKEDLLNNTCKEMWEFVDACNPNVPIKN
tara:strand:+ start:1167 stop:1406 length:240 start_codon:yes stop_codon:yes gene_type:complete